MLAAQLNKRRRTVAALVTSVKLQLARHRQRISPICILLSGFGPVQIYTSTSAKCICTLIRVNYLRSNESVGSTPPTPRQKNFVSARCRRRRATIATTELEDCACAKFSLRSSFFFRKFLLYYFYATDIINLW